MQRESSLVWKRCAAIFIGFAAVSTWNGAGLLEAQAGPKVQRIVKPPMNCTRVVFEGDVRAGEGFEKVFAPGLKFYLEPLRSGWIVRVLAANEPRGPHDYGELATPPYRSVSPLLISTDWSFRAQDAVAWNPRRFRYAASGEAFRRLAGLYGKVMANDPSGSAKAVVLASAQPEGLLRILDARIVPGLADQAQMAATVASHLAETPHTVDQSESPSPLGRVEELRFRVELDLAAGVRALPGADIEKILCSVPTSETSSASHRLIGNR
jgi:hypothetical protein